MEYLIILGSLLIYISGWIHGKLFEAYRWRRNSRTIFKIESAGKLYKTLTNEEYQNLINVWACAPDQE